MISIRLKNYKRPPARLLQQTCKRQIRRASLTRSGAVCSGNFYKDDSVRNLLKAYSIGKNRLGTRDEPKCFYCESKGEAMLVLEVEHYRPKDGLSSKDLTAGQVHDGYYWLGNEWSNLLLGCRNCNGSGAKGTRFPIINNPNRVLHEEPVSATLRLNRRVCRMDINPLLAEAPVILNPEYDVPEDHITFNKTSRQIIHKTGSFRGEKTIEILQLDRDTLFIARNNILNEFIEDIKTYIEARKVGKLTTDADLDTVLVSICRKINVRQNVDQAYTLWGRFINTEIEDLIVRKLPAAYRQNFRDAYQYAILNP